MHFLHSGAIKRLSLDQDQFRAPPAATVAPCRIRLELIPTSHLTAFIYCTFDLTTSFIQHTIDFTLQHNLLMDIFGIPPGTT